MTPPRLTNATPTVARAHANHTCALAFQEQENFRTENAGRPCSATLDKTRQGGHHDNTTNMIQTCGLTSSDIRQLPAVNSKEQNVPRKRQVDRLPLCSVCDTVVDECLRSVVYSLQPPKGLLMRYRHRSKPAQRHARAAFSVPFLCPTPSRQVPHSFGAKRFFLNRVSLFYSPVA